MVLHSRHVVESYSQASLDNHQVMAENCLTKASLPQPSSSSSHQYLPSALYMGNRSIEELVISLCIDCNRPLTEIDSFRSLQELIFVLNPQMRLHASNQCLHHTVSHLREQCMRRLIQDRINSDSHGWLVVLIPISTLVRHQGNDNACDSSVEHNSRVGCD
jgi:hypothetical protein